ncbi:MAG: DUF3810 domain-containing protein [Mogibacterium sp.]|nr:DUF3810 domain-containing protein [Mogibacterium sp.]
MSSSRSGSTNPRNNPVKQSPVRLWFPVLLLVVSAALSALARIMPGFADGYASLVYPLWLASLGRLSGLAAFCVAEILCLVLPVWLLADLIRNRKRLRRWLAHLVWLAAILCFLYTANCGVNYYRSSFVSGHTEEPSAVSEEELTADVLASFCEYTILQLRENPSDSYPDASALPGEAIRAMQDLGTRYPEFSGYYPRPKQLGPLSRLFSMSGVSGIYSPFTIEANINGEMPEYQKPFTACHELSHLRSYMNEGEANYIGWLACIGSGNESFRRSGWLTAWSYAGGSLRRTDPERYAKLRAALPEDAAAELEAGNLFWSTHENRASEIQDQLNDAYLKSNGQQEGIRTYGQLTRLMLQWYLRSVPASPGN